MAENIIVTFSLLFGATIALICAVYIYIMFKKKPIYKNKERYSQ